MLRLPMQSDEATPYQVVQTDGQQQEQQRKELIQLLSQQATSRSRSRGIEQLAQVDSRLPDYCVCDGSCVCGIS